MHFIDLSTEKNKSNDLLLWSFDLSNLDKEIVS